MNRGLKRIAAAAAKSLVLATMLCGAMGNSAAANDDCAWVPTFGGAPGVGREVNALTTFDDGSGEALYVGGDFTSAGGVAANYIAKWDGESWSSLGNGVAEGGIYGTKVNALAVYDDGSGSALYAGGDFTTAGGETVNHIAKWDGASWAPLGSGMNDRVYALAVFDDGSGPALYAGGYFNEAGGETTGGIAKWDGASWLPLGEFHGAVQALTVYDDGSGPALYAGGRFTWAGDVTVNDIAKWDGTTWSPLGSGMDDRVYALTVFDDGSGPALYAGGEFTEAGGVAANHIAEWDGMAWSPLDSGMSGNSGYVHALTAFNDGTGAALYAGGDFTTAGGETVNHIAKWDGASWSDLNGGVDGTYPSIGALTVFDDGSGPSLYAGGDFRTTDDATVNYIAEWDGATWTPLGGYMDGGIRALTLFDPPRSDSGPALYAGGYFTSIGGEAANRIARWDGATWTALGDNGMDDGVLALAVFDDGSGPALYAGGYFTIAGIETANHIAKWDGTSWSPLGSGLGGGGSYTYVNSLTVFDDGSGPALYAGGRFTTAGGVAANYIARWDGESWSPLGGGTDGEYPYVHALTVFDDGSGPALYVGGDFTIAGGEAVNHIAKWDGASWSTLDTGVQGDDGYTYVQSLTIFDDGTGSALYVGGEFHTAGGVPISSIAKWDGATWSSLESGVDGIQPIVSALTVFDDGSGPALYASGYFTTAGGIPANRIAKWDGASWTALDSGVSSPVFALSGFEDDSGPALYAAGSFRVSPAGDSYLAKWSCFPPCPGDIDGDSDTDQSDLGLLLASYELPTDDPFFDPRADLNDDGEVGQPDLGILLADYECGL